MSTSLKDKLQYSFEKYLIKGGSSIFISLFIVFVALFVLIIFLRWMILLIWSDLAYTDSFWDDIWHTWAANDRP